MAAAELTGDGDPVKFRHGRGPRLEMVAAGSFLGPRRSCGGGPWWQWRGGVAKPQWRGALRRNGVAELWRVRLLGLLAAAADGG